MKVNLTNLFRPQTVQGAVIVTEIAGESSQHRLPLHTTINPFLVDNKYALKLDEII